MSVADWMLVWKICLLGNIAAFAVMSVVVSIGGGYDLRRLFRRLVEDEDTTPSERE